MIPQACITEWRSQAPWGLDEQVEQDLVLSRAVVEIFSDPLLAESLAWRGGTALHKLYFENPARYSEDIDLVQVESGPIGPAMSAIRTSLGNWLGKPKWKQGHGRLTFQFKFESENPPIRTLRLKVEINTREHLTVMGLRRQSFSVMNPWFSGEAEVLTYAPEELLGTKLKALYQRRKGRDLFDLAVAFRQLENLDAEKVVECFKEYVNHDGLSISRAEFEANLAQKLEDRAFSEDLHPLLAEARDGRYEGFDAVRAGVRVSELLLERLPGDPWKGTAQI